jgi:hypothetical protein
MNSERRPARERIASIDVLRGLVMAVMLLDHTRDFIHNGAQSGNPLDLRTTTYALYFTRWVTHFCAPVFVFLAGASARLRQLHGVDSAEMSRYLATRGVWLIALELFVIRPLVWFNFDLSLIAQLQVIWAIGASMLVLALLVRLPVAAVGAIGLAIVAAHNAFDHVRVTQWNGPGTRRRPGGRSFGCSSIRTAPSRSAQTVRSCWCSIPCCPGSARSRAGTPSDKCSRGNASGGGARCSPSEPRRSRCS